MGDSPWGPGVPGKAETGGDAVLLARIAHQSAYHVEQWALLKWLAKGTRSV